MQTTTTATAVHTKPDFGQLYKENFNPIVAFLNRKLLDKQQAEDLALKVFDKAEAAYHRFEPTNKPIIWLMSITRNVLTDHYRRNQKHQAGEFDVNYLATNDNYNHLDYGVLYGAIDALSKEQREVIELRFFNGLGYEEIAKEAQIPVGTVKNRIHLAKKKLESLLVGIL